MKFAKRLLVIVGAVALAGGLAALLAPKTVHALVYTLIRDVDNPASEPFQGIVCTEMGLFSGTCAIAGFPATIQVPTTTTSGAAVKRLVIEYVNAFCAEQVGSGAVGFVTLTSTLNQNIATGQPGPTRTYFFTPQPVPGFTYLLVAGEQTRLYADPGTNIQFDVGFRGGQISFQCQAAISGHLVTR